MMERCSADGATNICAHHEPARKRRDVFRNHPISVPEPSPLPPDKIKAFPLSLTIASIAVTQEI